MCNVIGVSVRILISNNTAMHTLHAKGRVLHMWQVTILVLMSDFFFFCKIYFENILWANIPLGIGNII